MDLESSLAQVRVLAGPLDDLAQVAEHRLGFRVVAHKDPLRPGPPPAQEPQDLLTLLVGQLVVVGQRDLRLRVFEQPSRLASLKSSFISHKTAIDLGVCRVSTCGHVPRHPVNALPLRGGVAQLRDPPVDGLRHPAELVGVGLPFLAEAPVCQPLVESLGFKHSGSSFVCSVWAG